MELYLAGSGSFAAELAEWAGDAGWQVAGLIELVDLARVGTTVEGHPVIAPCSRPSGAAAVVAAGGDREAHWRLLAPHGWEPATVVHPGAHVSPSARLAAGCVVAPGAVIGAATTVGAHTLVSRGALIGHHCDVGAFVSLLPGANVGGHVEIGDRAAVSIGAVIINGLRVGAGATVAAGAVLVRDLRDGVRAQGVPAREYDG